MPVGKKIIVIGSGFAGLSAACFLAKDGFDVTILEKNDTIGGRARSFEESGFMFDMGPSWYWMPDVFERFFNNFGKKVADYYDLKLLEPSFSVFFQPGVRMDIPSKLKKLQDLFEFLEKGAGDSLNKFMADAKYKYEVGMRDLVYKPAHSWIEFVDWRVIKSLFKLHLTLGFSKHVRQYFRDQRLISLLEFPVLFLGARPEDTPALYSLMNYAGLSLGTWYPMGGMKEIVIALKKLAESLGVKIETSAQVKKINVEKGKAVGVTTYNNNYYKTDAVVSSADYNFTEQKLLEPQFRNYTPSYWEKRVMAPSSLIFYLGINKKIKNLQHHNLFFDEDFSVHAKEIYTYPQWPQHPLFYVCCPSKTDGSVAPEGMENIFILMPIAVGLKDNESIREKYFDILISRMEKNIGESVRDNIIYKRSYAGSNFITDYNAFKGNAYGLANTLRQTAFLKPSIRNKKVRNLFYCGQLTVPGPGVPPALISGQITAKEVIKHLNKYKS